MLKITKQKIASHNNKDVIEYTLTQPSGFSVSIQNYGGVISKIMTPDKTGVLQNVVLASTEFDSINRFHLGAIAGRIAGRIRGGKFTLNDKEYQISLNRDPNHLHGGFVGFNKQFWNVVELSNGIELSYLAKDGEEGYPGNLLVKISYLLDSDNELTLKTELITDKDGIANLTNHSYFDLSAGRDPMSVEMQINADYYAPVDKSGCALSQLNDVTNTAFDFRGLKAINHKFDNPDEQMVIVNHGYDHPFLLNSSHAVHAVDKKHTGIILDITTDEPCCVVYSSNWLEPKKHSGICFETQKMPNAINWPEYRDSVIIRANEVKTNITKWKFGVYCD